MLKKTIFTALFLGLVQSSFADSLIGTIGASSQNDSSYSIGYRFGRNGNFGIQLGMINDKYQSGIPDAYTGGTFYSPSQIKTSSTVGADIVSYFPINYYPIRMVFTPYIGLGVYSEQQAQLVTDSNNQPYLYNKNYQMKAAGQAGILFSVNRDISLGVGYHSLRGTEIAINLNL